MTKKIISTLFLLLALTSALPEPVITWEHLLKRASGCSQNTLNRIKAGQAGIKANIGIQRQELKDLKKTSDSDPGVHSGSHTTSHTTSHGGSSRHHKRSGDKEEAEQQPQLEGRRKWEEVEGEVVSWPRIVARSGPAESDEEQVVAGVERRDEDGAELEIEAPEHVISKRNFASGHHIQISDKINRPGHHVAGLESIGVESKNSLQWPPGQRVETPIHKLFQRETTQQQQQQQDVKHLGHVVKGDNIPLPPPFIKDVDQPVSPNPVRLPSHIVYRPRPLDNANQKQDSGKYHILPIDAAQENKYVTRRSDVNEGEMVPPEMEIEARDPASGDHGHGTTSTGTHTTSSFQTNKGNLLHTIDKGVTQRKKNQSILPSNNAAQSGLRKVEKAQGQEKHLAESLDGSRGDRKTIKTLKSDFQGGIKQNKANYKAAGSQCKRDLEQIQWIRANMPEFMSI